MTYLLFSIAWLSLIPVVGYLAHLLNPMSGYYIIDGVKYKRKITYASSPSIMPPYYSRSYTYVTARKEGEHIVTVRNKIGKGYAKVKVAAAVPKDIESTAAFLLLSPVKFHHKYRGDHSDNLGSAL